eukprot:COSAG02_NODE_4967_length_4773_cov_44.423834_7_plen_104_part_00
MRCAPRVELPVKSFGADGGGALSKATTSFAALQSGDGPLTTEFVLGGIKGRRMVTGYHAWRLQRIKDVLKSCTETPEGRAAVRTSAKTKHLHTLVCANSRTIC